MSELRESHLFSFETDYGAVYALAVAHEVEDDGTFRFHVGLSFCSPQDRSKPRKLRKRIAFKKCFRRLAECPMSIGVPPDMQFAEYLKMRVAEEVQHFALTRKFHPQVTKYAGRKSRSAFIQWFGARGPKTFLDQFSRRYCGEAEKALDV
jgi:hypothetical protein